MTGVVPQNKDSRAFAREAEKKMVGKRRKVGATKARCDERKTARSGRDAGDDGLKLLEEAIRQERAGFGFVVIEDGVKVFLNETMKDHRKQCRGRRAEGSAAQFALELRPSQTGGGVLIEFAVAAAGFGDALVGIRENGG